MIDHMVSRNALAAGGQDNGAPGPRGPEQMHDHAAFVLDPDGNNVEAAFRSQRTDAFTWFMRQPTSSLFGINFTKLRL